MPWREPNAPLARGSPLGIWSLVRPRNAATLRSELLKCRCSLDPGERAYGSVEAPGWVLPLGAVLAIGTSLLPMCAAHCPLPRLASLPHPVLTPGLYWQLALSRGGGLPAAAERRGGDQGAVWSGQGKPAQHAQVSNKRRVFCSCLRGLAAWCPSLWRGRGHPTLDCSAPVSVSPTMRGAHRPAARESVSYHVCMQ